MSVVRPPPPDPAPPRRSGARRRAASAPAPTGCWPRVPTGVLWAPGRPVDDPDPRPAGQVVPRPRTSSSDQRLVDGVHRPAASRSRTTTGARSTRRRRRCRMWRGTSSTRFAITIPATLVPDRHRRRRGLRLRVDGLQGPQLAVHRAWWRCWRCRSRCRWSRCCSSTPAAPTSRCSARPSRCSPTSTSAARPIAVWLTHTALRPAAGHLPAAQLHRRRCRATSSRRPASTAPTTRRSSGGSCCRCRCRRWPPSPSSSSCGCGTTTCVALDLPRPEPGRAAR